MVDEAVTGHVGDGADELGQRLGEGEVGVAGGRGCAGVEQGDGLRRAHRQPWRVVDVEPDPQPLAGGDRDVVARDEERLRGLAVEARSRTVAAEAQTVGLVPSPATRRSRSGPRHSR